MRIEDIKWKRSGRVKFGCLNVALAVCLLLIASFACSLPDLTPSPPEDATPTLEGVTVGPISSPIPPTPTPPILPPILVESAPFPGAQISTQGHITLYFNQAMDQTSVENAILAQDELSGEFQWEDDATVTFIPDVPFSPTSYVEIFLDQSVRAANGLTLRDQQSLTYEVVGYLHVTQGIPEAGSVDVDPTSAIVTSFNRPMIMVGGSDEHHPAFWLEPAVEGSGEWINISTYIFYPEPALAGGTEYTVYLDPDLTSIHGSRLQEPVSWSFSTLPVQVVSIAPTPGARNVRLDSRIRMEFNQPMDVESVEANLVLLDPTSKPVPGEFSWNEELTEVIYKPRYFLKRDLTYTVLLDEGAMTLGGTAISPQVETIWKTNPAVELIGTEPFQNGSIDVDDPLLVYFTSPIQTRNVLQFISVIPRVDDLQALVEDEGRTLHLYGDFTPETTYSLIISPNLPDAWSGRLGEDFVLNFQTRPLEPELILIQENDFVFFTPQDSSLNVEVTNLEQISFSVGSVPLETFTQIINPDGMSLLESYTPQDQRTIQHSLELPVNQRQKVELPLTMEDEPIQPGLYRLEFNVPNIQNPGKPFLLVVSNMNLTFKIGAKDAMVWAIDLRTNEPISEAAISIFAGDGELLGSGLTDTDGIYKVSIDPPEEDFFIYYAVLDQPGDDTFGLALSNWNQGLENWNYCFSTDYRPSHLVAYIYSDRPVYQPGETLFFRSVVRQAHNGRYRLPDEEDFPDGILSLSLQQESGELISEFNLPLSTYGTAHGSYSLPAGLRPGIYQLAIEEIPGSRLNFEVITQHQPGIELDVSFSHKQVLAGQALQAFVKTRYIFGSPAPATPVQWALYREPVSVDLPGYHVGTLDLDWLNPLASRQDASLQTALMEGEGVTGGEGELTLEFLPAVEAGLYRYILEATSEDESGFPVSARAEVLVSSTEFLVAVLPDNWIGQAGSPLGFEVLVLDLNQVPYGELSLRAEFQHVVWERDRSTPPDSNESVPTFLPHYTLIGSTDFITAPDGVARLSFTPPGPGIYQLDVSSLQPESPSANTQILIWVGGLGEAAWPDLPNQRLHLVATKDSYQPGETAQVFLPNPFGENTLALVTVERGVMLRHRVLELEGAGTNLYLPLADEDAPNVIVSVTILGTSVEGRPDYRHGYINLPVEPREHIIHIEFIDLPEMINPGRDLSVGIRVTNAEGNPVVGEFSLSVVAHSPQDMAPPSSEDIVEAFYANQPLGVRTAIPISAYIYQPAFFGQPPVGDDMDSAETPSVPYRLPLATTAYWDAEIVTDEQGEAEITVPLSEEVTSWHILVRGLTEDTRVGQAEVHLVVTKELLIRPITPRFLVMGDHSRLAAEVTNNSQQDLVVEVELDASGFELDDPSAARQSVQILAGGKAQVYWWGQPHDVTGVDLVFSAKAVPDGEDDSQTLEDLASLPFGMLPVIHNYSSASFEATGFLDSRAEHRYLVSLPRSFDALSGELRVELSTSLVASMMTSLDFLENSPSDLTEQIVSKFLPNLRVFLIMRELGMNTTVVQSRLDRTLQEGITELLSRQNSDGGWGWLRGDKSDEYISAYVVYGLSQARAAGAPVDGRALQLGIAYLEDSLLTIDMLSETWQFDRLAFIQYILSQVGAGDLNAAADLYDVSLRLNPGARALLALTLDSFSPGDLRAQSLLDELSSEAIRSNGGVYWQDHTPNWRNLNSTLQTSAMVLYALVLDDADSALSNDTIRYLMSQREVSGGWSSTYETAWILMALAETIQTVSEPVAGFNYSASINDTLLASGEGSEELQLTPVLASRNIRDLHPNYSNILVIQRDAGPGALYYSALLLAEKPVERVAAAQNGFYLTRQYFPAACKHQAVGTRQNCTPVASAKPGDLVEVRLTLTVADMSHFVVVEDYIPAGAEILDTQLKVLEAEDANVDLPRYSGEGGWGWWFFSQPQVNDDHISWVALSLAPGTYELSYKLVILYPGEYGVLPARAWQYYTPEIKSNSEGDTFRILADE